MGAKIWSSCKTGFKRWGTWVLLTVSWGASMRSCIICFSADKAATLAAAICGPVRSVLRLHLLHSWESSAALLSTAAVLPTPSPDTKSKLATPLQAYSVSLAKGGAVCSQNSVHHCSTLASKLFVQACQPTCTASAMQSSSTDPTGL